MQASCTEELVKFTIKPVRPRPQISPAILGLNFMLSRVSRRIAFFPVRNRSTQRADTAWEIMVARAAPLTPIPMPKIIMGSSTMFSTAPMAMVIMPVLPKPWELIKAFIPRLIIIKMVPAE